MTSSHRAGPHALAVSVRVSPAWWRRRSPRQVRVDGESWHVQRSDGAWHSIRPDRIDMGPGRLWLTISGPLPGPIPSRRWRSPRLECTVWAGSVAPDGWRRLHIAACRHMQQAASAGRSP